MLGSRQCSFLVLVALFAGSASAQVFPLQEFPIAMRCNDAAFGDFNGDGLLDCVAANANLEHASLLLSRGDGSFEPARTFGAADYFMNVIVGDVDGDSKLDAILLSGLMGFELWLGDGAGGLTPHAMPAPSSTVAGFTLGDISGDGHVDFVVTTASPWDLAVYPGDGTGNFGAPTTIALPGGPLGGIVAEDLDLDLDLDVALLVSPSFSGSELLVCSNSGAGVLSPTAWYPNVAGDLRAAHMNSDLALDLVAGGGFELQVLLNDGSGAFIHTPVPLNGGPIASFDLNDVDGDGDLDAATSGDYEPTLATLLNDGQGQLSASATYRVGRTGYLGLGDVDGDGRVDALTAGSYLQVQLGRGAGRFEDLLDSPASLSGFGSTTAVTVADFDGDGSLDTAAVSGFANRVNVALNDGSGTFQATWSHWLGSDHDPRDIGAGDFDEDGTLDLVIVNNEDDTLGWLRGLGAGSFAAPAYIGVGLDPEDLEVVDLDRDTHLDVISTSSGASDVVLSRGDGHGNFFAPTPYPVGFGHPLALAVGDFDGDLKLDLAVAMSTFAPTVSLLFGDGLGGLGAPLTIATSPQNAGPVIDVAAADFDGDGLLDLACVNGGMSELAFLFNQGAGDFTSPRVYGVRAEQARSLEVADFDGDGVLDTAVTGYRAGPSIRLGTGWRSFSHEANYALPNDDLRAFAAADFDGDGRIDLLSSLGAGYENVVSLNRGDAPNGTCASEAYCYPSGNSAFSSGASLDASGSFSIAQNSFTLAASRVVPNTNALFLYGTKRQAVPFGAGFLCVSGPAIRLGPVQTANAQGALARTLDFTVGPLASGPGQITPGTPWHFQLWFRDAASFHPSKVNLSTAVQATFCP